MFKIINTIFFTGIPFSLPIGAILARIYGGLALAVRRAIRGTYYYVYLERVDYQVMFFLAGITIVVFFCRNVKRMFLDKETVFIPFIKTPVTEKSPDKKKAQYKAPPRKYLSKNPDGFTVGEFYYGPKKYYVRLEFMDSPEHMLILGSPGSNKSTTLLNALLNNYNFASPEDQLRAVLAIDAKPELSKKSVDESGEDVRIINPTTKDAFGFDPWFGIDQNSSDDEIKERAEDIAKALIPSLSGDNAHFSGNAQKILSGFLMYGFRKGFSFTDSIVKVMEASVSNLIAEMVSDPEMEDHPKILHKVKGFDTDGDGRESDEFASIKHTLEQNLDIFDTDTVQYCFSENPRKVTPEDLLNGISIFLAIPDNLLTQYRTVFGMIMELCLKHLMAVSEDDLRGERPIWCLIDEGGTIYVPSLHDVASRGRSKRIQLSLVAQSYSQLEDLYGDREACSILDCCKTTIVFSCNDTRTARDLSAWTGTYRETKIATQKRPLSALAGPTSMNESEEYRSVMEIADIKNLEKNNEVLVFAKGDWFLVKKSPYYTIDIFEEMSEELQEYNRSRNHPLSDTSTSAMSDKSHYGSEGVRHLIEKMNLDKKDNTRR